MLSLTAYDLSNLDSAGSCIYKDNYVVILRVYIFTELSHIFLIAIAALFPPINPIGTALLVDPQLANLNRSERIRASFAIALYSFSICSGSVLVGAQVFRFFGISMPAVQIAGGLLIFKMGYDTLYAKAGAIMSDSNNSEKSDKKVQWLDTENKLFYPLAFPMTTGAGTISVLLTLTANTNLDSGTQYLEHTIALLLASLFMCTLVFFCYAYTYVLLGNLSQRGAIVLNKLSGFITVCVGIQILVGGLTTIIKNIGSQ